jgi:hypothetical protein
MTQRTPAPRRFGRSLLCCALAGCMAMAAPVVLAQSTSATLQGRVSADSAPASDARVTATNLATGLTRSVQATASGRYSLGGLPPGTYRVRLTVDGKEHTLGPGSYFALTEKMPHTAKVEGNEEAVFFIQADGAWDVVMEK